MLSAIEYTNIVHIFIYKRTISVYSRLMGNERLNGELITEWMEKTKTSYDALAAQIGVCPNMARSMEKGGIPRRNREAILSKLAGLIGTSVGALVIKEETKKAG